MRFKHIVTSISASFDDLVSKIENHEAVADVTIQDVRAAAAKIRTQLNITRQRTETLQNQEQNLIQDCARWQARALQCGSGDQERALRCVQALEQVEQHKIANARQLQENLQLQKELQRHLQKIEQRLVELQRKRESLSARAALNKVTRHVEKTLPGCDPEAVFARWEQSVLTDEYAQFPLADAMPEQELDREFRQRETQERLEARLAELLAGNTAAQSQEKSS